MSKIVVIGGSGQLGQCIKSLVSEFPSLELVFLSREEADILEPSSLAETFGKYKPDFCVNCAAYTAVDKAEDEQDLAMKINQEGVANLTLVCKQHQTTLIHISTDFVFAGDGVHPLDETHPLDPVNIYGKSKAGGELEIQKVLTNYFIIRTSWLYSEFGGNFLKTMLRFGKEREELKVIWDQAGTPTYGVDLARFIFTIITAEKAEYGIYHFSNEGLTSWYDFAKAIFELSGMPTRVIPVRTSEYYTKAKRPPYSVLDKRKAKANFQMDIPHWRESLKVCLQKVEQ